MWFTCNRCLCYSYTSHLVFNSLHHYFISKRKKKNLQILFTQPTSTPFSFFDMQMSVCACSQSAQRITPGACRSRCGTRHLGDQTLVCSVKSDVIKRDSFAYRCIMGRLAHASTKGLLINAYTYRAKIYLGLL